MALIGYYVLTNYLPEKKESPIMRAVLDAQNSIYHLTFRYDPNVIIQVKSLEGRRWNPKEKEWTVPALPGVGDKLNSMGFQVEMPMGVTEIQVPKINFDSISGFKKEALFPYQREGVEFIESRDGNALLADCMGLGKAQPLHSNILGANGWIKMGDIKLGDSIFGEDGKLHEVIGIYPQGVQKVYRVTFTDGSKCECTEDHLWNVRTPSDKYYGKGYRTLTLKQIIKSGLHLRCGTKWFIPTTKPVRFAEQSLPVDPYVMGYLLGNGHITNKGVSVTIPDKEVKEYIDNKVKRNKSYLSNTANSNNIDYRFKTTDKNSRNRMVRTLTALGLDKKSYEKFIPDRYKFSSCKQRIALLQGLMDSDGCTGGGITEYCTTSYQLMQDVKFLVHSLGGKANLSIKKNPKYIYNGEVRTGRTAYRLFITFSNNINPFLLKRKADSFIKNTKYKITRGISKVEYVGESPCQCISTSNPTSLYLTDDLIVTHNTIQIIAWLAFRPEVRPAVIVCPASLKHNWKNEIMKWITVPCNGAIIDGKGWKTTYFGKCDPTANLDYIIINYDILASNLDYLLKFKPKVLICDESHFLKNEKALRTKAALKLSREVPKVICISGTPIVNRPIEMYNAIRMVSPSLFPNKYRFGYEFCGLHKTRFGLNWNGATNTNKLHNILKSSIMIRRTKDEVLKDLPPKIHTALSLPITNGSQYGAAERDFINWVVFEKGYEKAKAAANAEALVKMNYLKQLAVEGKMPSVYEWIENFFDENPNKKLVLFAENRSVIDSLMNHCSKYGAVKIDGSVSSADRSKIVDTFQNNPDVKVFVGNIRAAGVGITLTAADTVAFIQLAWTPGEMEQASDRLNRIGAKFTTNVYYLIADGTIEEDICELLDKKRAILNAILDGDTDGDSSMYRDLIDKYKERQS